MITWSTAKKRLQEQGVKFTNTKVGLGLCDIDVIEATIDIYLPNIAYPDSETITLWQAYKRMSEHLALGSRLSNDRTTILNYYALCQIFKGLEQS